MRSLSFNQRVETRRWARRKMMKVRKIPVVVEATQWFQNGDHPLDGDETFVSSTGYGAITFTAANWVTTGGAPSHTDYPQQTFTSSANQTTEQEFGYYFTQVTSGKLVWSLFRQN